jgi:hypothetical protein
VKCNNNIKEGILGRQRRRWMDNIKIDLRETDVAQDSGQWRALVNTVMNLRVP